MTQRIHHIPGSKVVDGDPVRIALPGHGDDKKLGTVESVDPDTLTVRVKLDDGTGESVLLQRQIDVMPKPLIGRRVKIVGGNRMRGWSGVVRAVDGSTVDVRVPGPDGDLLVENIPRGDVELDDPTPLAVPCQDLHVAGKPDVAMLLDVAEHAIVDAGWMLGFTWEPASDEARDGVLEHLNRALAAVRDAAGKPAVTPAVTPPPAAVEWERRRPNSTMGPGDPEPDLQAPTERPR